MKKIFLPLALFISAAVCAQSNSTEAGAGESGSKKKDETKITAVVNTDSLPPGELLKRAVNWVKTENPVYTKSSGITTGSKAECTVSFPVKPKELNPQCDYTGKIMMKVLIECKDNRYKYTIFNIKHTSTSGKASAGSVDNIVPECGSMIMPDITWKKLKGDAMTKAGSIVGDIKEGMEKLSSDTDEADEW